MHKESNLVVINNIAAKTTYLWVYKLTDTSKKLDGKTGNRTVLR